MEPGMPEDQIAGGAWRVRRRTNRLLDGDPAACELLRPPDQD